MKISELTKAAVRSPDMMVPVELYGQTMRIGMGQLEGLDGEDALTVTVTSDKGDKILNGEGERRLTATVWLGGADITGQLAPECFSWRRKGSNAVDDAMWNRLHAGVGNEITIDASEVNRSAVFICDVAFDA